MGSSTFHIILIIPFEFVIYVNGRTQHKILDCGAPEIGRASNRQACGQQPKTGHMQQAPACTVAISLGLSSPHRVGGHAQLIDATQFEWPL